MNASQPKRETCAPDRALLQRQDGHVSLCAFEDKYRYGDYSVEMQEKQVEGKAELQCWGQNTSKVLGKGLMGPCSLEAQASR